MDRVVDGVWIGDRDDARDHGDEFEAVVTLHPEPMPETTIHAPIVDGPNPWRDWVAAVGAVRRTARGEGRLLVHCQRGVSRSAAVLATALAAEHGWSLGEAIETVRRARPRALPHAEFYVPALSYLFAPEWSRSDTFDDDS